MTSRGVALGSEAALCLVDIDKPDIQLPEELPILPHRTPFTEELNHVLDKHQVYRKDMFSSRVKSCGTPCLPDERIRVSGTFLVICRFA